jgi:hypothetical protein
MKTPRFPSDLTHATRHPTRRGFLATGLSASALLSVGLGGSGAAFAQALAPRPFTTRVIQSGHSLTDPIVPELEAIVRAAGGADTIGMKMDRSTIPGSPMDWRWENRNQHMPDARYDIAGYDVMVLTERVPLSNTMPWHGSEDSALRYFENAWTNGNGGKGAETVFYASWVEVDSGPGADNPHKDPEREIPFRKRLDLEMVGWEKIVTSVNERRPAGSPAMTMIPGPLIMAALYDAVQAGTVPGIARIEDVFSDNIHINSVGAFMIALAHYAVIYRRDPRELPARLGTASAGSQATVDWMKEMVWDVVSRYRYSGLA